jgi:hypothetical protein
MCELWAMPPGAYLLRPVGSRVHITCARPLGPPVDGFVGDATGAHMTVTSSNLRKPHVSGTCESATLYASEVTAQRVIGEPGVAHLFSRVTNIANFNVVPVVTRLDEDGTQVQFATSAELLQLGAGGVFGRFATVLNDFIGGRLVSLEEYAMLNIAPHTSDRDIHQAEVSFTGTNGFSQVVNGSNGSTDSVFDFGFDQQIRLKLENFGGISSALFIITHQDDGSFDASLAAEMLTATDLAIFDAKVAPQLDKIAASVPGMHFVTDYTSR